MCRTFNIWFVIMPSTMIIAIMAAVMLVNEGKNGARRIVSDEAFQKGIKIYSVVTGFVLLLLFTEESLLGTIELIGRDIIDAEQIARFTLGLVALFWAIAIYATALILRHLTIRRIDRNISQGNSWRDRIRRKRAIRQQRADEKRRQKQLKMAREGNVYIVDFQNDESRIRKIRAQSKEQSVSETVVGHYKIVKCDDLGRSYTDAIGEKRSIADLLEDGAKEYFVAIDLEDDDASPLFLGSNSEEAVETLRRYLRETEAAQA